jgi:hypothetical protein
MSDELADSVGPWAKEKLEALGRYLDFYTKVLKNQPGRRSTLTHTQVAGGRCCGLLRVKLHRYCKINPMQSWFS